MLARARLAVIAGAVTLGALLSASAASAAPGELDSSFGSGGIVQVLASNEESNAKGVAVQPDDKVVIAGYEPPGNLVVIRLLENGQPDPSFGAGGKVVTVIPGGFSEARAVTIQADGKILVAGGALGSGEGDFLFARFNPDGSPDLSFGSGDGVTIVPVGTGYDEAEAVAVGADGTIAATGRSEDGKNVDVAGVAVLHNSGVPEPTFGSGGTTTIKTPEGEDEGVAIAVLDDGRVLVGDASGAGGGDGFSLVQLTPTGAPDPSFGGGDGMVLTPVPGTGMPTAGGRISDFALLGDGRIVTSGYGYDYLGIPPTNDSKVAAARYLPNGELDPSFSGDGFFTQQLGGSDSAQAIAVAEGGKLLLAGMYDDPASSMTAPWVLRLDPGGALDPAFGAGGVVLRGQTAPFGEYVADAAVDSFDRLVTIGTAYQGGGATWIAVTRYLGDRLPPVPANPNQAPHARMKKVPRKVAAAELKGFSGTASDPDGDALRKVQVALVKLVPGGAKASRRAARKCFTLKSRKARFKPVRVKRGERCPQRWLAVKGKAKWSFRLKRSLPPGRYVVYARAVDAEGLAEAAFSRKAGNRYEFRVRPSN